MKKLKFYLKCALTAFFMMCVFLSCSTDDKEFVVSQESTDLSKIANVKLVDKVGQSEIEVTTDYVKEKWENALIDEGFDVKLEKFQILESFDEIKQSKVYFLKAVSKDGTIETGAFLSSTDVKGVYVLEKKTCSCQGCPTGCNLVVSGSSCSCSPCTGPNKSCTKTETVVIE